MQLLSKEQTGVFLEGAMEFIGRRLMKTSAQKECCGVRLLHTLDQDCEKLDAIALQANFIRQIDPRRLEH